MSLRQYWWDVKHRFKHQMFEYFPAEGLEAADKYAEAAYACCVEWYGLPFDPQKPYCVAQSMEGNSFCRLMFGKYQLAISKEASTPELLCSDIAHEMYHRVTAERKGLASEMWVQEMMACLTSYWFLRGQGFREYADRAKKHWLSEMVQADVGDARARQRQKMRNWVMLGQSIYPKGFTETVLRIGYALDRLLDGDDLRRIIKATTLEEWVATLPTERQYAVCRVLDIATGDKAIPSDEKGLDRLFDALEAKGDSDTPIAEFKQVVQLQPENGVAFFYLGYAHDVAEEHDAAIDAYLQAWELGYSDKWLPHNLGDLYWQAGNYAAAAEWFQKAVNQAPDWARPCYSLGRSLNAQGNMGAARQFWEKVLTLGDEHYANLAQKALEKNPLPDEAARS